MSWVGKSSGAVSHRHYSQIFKQIEERRKAMDYDRKAIVEKFIRESELSRTEVLEFVKWLDKCILRCTNLNVKRARQAMLGIVDGTPERLGQVIQWMAEYFNGLSVETGMYVLNDCLHHLKKNTKPDFHLEYDNSPLRQMFEAYEQENEPSSRQLMEIWVSREYLPREVTNTWYVKKTKPQAPLQFSRDLPFYELPASLILESVVPGTTIYLNELEELPGTAPNEEIQSALECFYSDLESATATTFNEIDIENDKYTYSGWSRGFVEERVNRFKQTRPKEEDEGTNSTTSNNKVKSTRLYNAVPPPLDY
ncbi:hypothetical protein TRVA0_053S00782 [Trichomonascus vanleenenianus]|uniref:uncharacterized protein n=1 Tax=Trichomonascus vanleenenianus TaxID=2268995 RepID=UPI003ECB2489